MWCIIVLGLIGLVTGVVCAIIHSDLGDVWPYTIFGIIAGAFVAAVISIAAWMFVPSDSYSLIDVRQDVVAQNAAGEPLYFDFTYDDSSNVYLHYLNANHKIEKVYLANAEVHFVAEGEPAQVKTYNWQYNNSFLRATAIIPLNKFSQVTHIYISESNWLKCTEGGMENVLTHSVES